MSVTGIDLQKAAKEHLWMHFTRMGGYSSADVPIIVRGDGCYLEDADGKRYLDALAGLFSVNIGYSFGEEVGQAALEQMRELPFYTNWSYAHPKAIELAAELASLAPGDLNRVFFCSSGSEAVESAPGGSHAQYTPPRGGKADGTPTSPRFGPTGPAGPPHRYKAIARHVAYHGDDARRALDQRDSRAARALPAARPRGASRLEHEPLPRRGRRPRRSSPSSCSTSSRQTIVSMGPETVCLVHMEPVQNAGGAFTPPAGYFSGVRELCDRYDILLCADEVITAFGRVGYWFGSERYDIRPDLVTCAKGLSSSYAAIGAVVATDRVMEPFLAETSMFSHGITFGGHPTMSAIALKNIEIMKREGIVEHVRESEDAFRDTLAQLLDLPIVGDLRGTGVLHALELVKDKDSRETFSEEECERLLRGYPRTRLRRRPHLQSGRPRRSGHSDLAAARRRPAEFDEITRILGEVLTEAQREMS